MLLKIYFYYFITFFADISTKNEDISFSKKIPKNFEKLTRFLSTKKPNHMECTHQVIIFLNIMLFPNNITVNMRNKGNLRYIFDDPNLIEQWYFVRSTIQENLLSHELNYLWDAGITGQRVNIGMVDGGIEVDHKDLKENFKPDLSYNFITNSKRIYPSNYGRPTRSVGIISATANNGKCGVGASPHSFFANLQIFDDYNTNLDDRIVSQAISYKRNIIQIYVMCWSKSIYGEINNYPGNETVAVLLRGYMYGRNRLGNIFVIGTGNSRIEGNNCAFDGLLQRPEILVFGAVSASGSIPLYLEGCNAVLAASLSSAVLYTSNQIFTTNNYHMCSKCTTGSSASIAISAGILALLISYNTLLTVRQIRILIILTSIQYDPNSVVNSAGFYYSEYFGFGLLNAKSLVDFSSNDTIMFMLSEHICYTGIFKGVVRINKFSYENFHIYYSGCLDRIFCVTRVEQVYVVFTVTSSHRNSIKIDLTSPSGTKFTILNPRHFDKSRNGFHHWRLKLLGFFGERPLGIWTVKVHTGPSFAWLLMFELIIYGTCINPWANIISHMNANKYIVQHFSKNKTKFFSPFPSVVGVSFHTKHGQDLHSFGVHNFPNIEWINTLI